MSNYDRKKKTQKWLQKTAESTSLSYSFNSEDCDFACTYEGK